MSLVAGGAVAAPAAAMAAVASTDVPQPSRPPGYVALSRHDRLKRTHIRKLEAEVDEIVRYNRALEAATPCSYERAFSIPFATMPISRQLTHPSRQAEETFGIPAPRIPEIYSNIRNVNVTGFESLVCTMLANKLGVVPKGFQVTPNITLTDKHGKPVGIDRVVTPRYCFDIEDPALNPQRIAVLFADAVRSIWHEWDEKRAQARAVIRTGRHSWQASPVEEFQMTPVDMFVKREAFMLEIMWWNIGAGFISQQFS
jgi:hypothetical protein